ncbi:hypothetical protein DENSPDRAFT_880630 [Dentipellis sp. KUC8613]|nr:hypothetical protein DENSPDRAFT_880630 [Dentipellis sp. KUC8613]
MFEGSEDIVVGATPSRTGDISAEGSSALVSRTESNAATTVRQGSNALAFCAGFITGTSFAD